MAVLSIGSCRLWFFLSSFSNYSHSKALWRWVPVVFRINNHSRLCDVSWMEWQFLFLTSVWVAVVVRSAPSALSSISQRGAQMCFSLQSNVIYRNSFLWELQTLWSENCLTFPKAWEIQMERCLSGTGLGLGWLLGRLPTFRQQVKNKIKNNLSETWVTSGRWTHHFRAWQQQ